MSPRTRLCVVFAGVAVVVFAVYWRAAMQGFSARAEPSGPERLLANFARAMAMPADAGGLQNPLPFSSEVEREALAHYADHCAICHANNGSGNTMFGKGLYPHPPDLRSSHTQQMSDGQIFYIVENGIRMSGMPAFGGSDAGEASWKLVYFIRHLPRLEEVEEQKMESLNPKGPEQWKEQQEEEQFLSGGSPSPSTGTSRNPKGRLP